MSRFGGMGRAPHAPYPQILELPRRFLESHVFIEHLFGKSIAQEQIIHD